MSELAWLLLALPSFGAVVLLLGGRRTDRWGHLLGCATVLGAFAVGVVLFADLLGRHGEDRAIHLRRCSPGCRSASCRWTSGSWWTRCRCASCC